MSQTFKDMKSQQTTWYSFYGVKFAEETALMISVKKCFLFGSTMISSLIALFSNWVFAQISTIYVTPLLDEVKNKSWTVGWNYAWVITSLKSSKFGGFMSTIEKVVLFVSKFHTFTQRSSQERKCSPSGERDNECIW